MENAKPTDKYVNFSNASSLVAYSLILAGAFSILRCHLYYQLLLNIPIFHYIDASELFLMSASTGTVLVIYLAAINLPNFINEQTSFTTFQKIVFSTTVYAFGITYGILSYFNDPIITAIVKWPVLVKNYFVVAGFLLWTVLIIIAFIKKPVFFKENQLIMPVMLTLFYALFSAWGNYHVITVGKNPRHTILYTKTGGVIATNDTLVDAGRTKGYWFFYNRKTHKTRVINAGDIDSADFSK